MTVLLTPKNRIATKRWVNDGTGQPTLIDYDRVKMFSGYTLPVSDIYQLSAALTMLESIPQALVIRGAPLSHVDLTSRHRRTLENFQTPNAGRHWMLIDLDKIKVPTKLTVKGKEAQLREYLINLLPAEFHNTTYHWQLSSKAGMVKSKAVSMHFWFWLDQSVPDAGLKAWAKWVNQRAGIKLIDIALFNAVQAHYTAAPVFERVKDPVKQRSGLHRGKMQSVLIVLPPPGALVPSARHSPARTKVGRSVQKQAPAAKVVGFKARLAQIGDHPGGEGFHNAILSATASYVSANVMDDAEIEKLYRIVNQATLAADASNHDARYIANQASRETIIPMIRDAIKKFSKTPPARKKGRLHVGIPPSFTGPTMTVTEASLRLRNLVADFFK